MSSMSFGRQDRLPAVDSPIFWCSLNRMTLRGRGGVLKETTWDPWTQNVKSYRVSTTSHLCHTPRRRRDFLSKRVAGFAFSENQMSVIYLTAMFGMFIVWKQRGKQSASPENLLLFFFFFFHLIVTLLKLRCYYLGLKGILLNFTLFVTKFIVIAREFCCCCNKMRISFRNDVIISKLNRA